MTVEQSPTDPTSVDESHLHARKKEYKELKAKYNELRDKIKADIEERKALEDKLSPIAVELGIEFKSKKKSKESEAE